MTDKTTSIVVHRSAGEEWRGLLAFLARPDPPARATGIGVPGFVAVLRLFALDAVLMCGLALIAGIAMATGFEIPKNRLDAIELTPGWIAAIVVGAPLFEEIVFRSWLSGRPRHLVAGLCTAAAIILLIVMGSTGLDEFVLSGITVLTLILAAIIAGFKLPVTHPGPRFSRYFPVIFWATAAAFALAHLVNYDESASPVLLALVLPQFVLGTLLGFARVQYGLWAAILLHALHNGTAVLLLLSATHLAPGT